MLRKLARRAELHRRAKRCFSSPKRRRRRRRLARKRFARTDRRGLPERLGTLCTEVAYSRAVRSDRPGLPTTTPDLEALVARIHQDLRKERRARKWREGAPDRRKTLIALLLLLIPLAGGIALCWII